MRVLLVEDNTNLSGFGLWRSHKLPRMLEEERLL